MTASPVTHPTATKLAMSVAAQIVIRSAWTYAFHTLRGDL